MAKWRQYLSIALVFLVPVMSTFAAHTEGNTYFTHPLAEVQLACIGQDTKIWQYAIILESTKISTNCNICAHTLIEGDVILGHNVTVKSGVYLWNGTRIEDNVFIGSNATFTNDKFPRLSNTQNLLLAFT
jgi:UDP-3-O-[3-hydroxymyristoyl] glucosamine N-acyltransferase